MFKPNLHYLDRLIRLAVGIACIYVGFVNTAFISNSLISTLVGIFGIINLIAAAMAHCPIYHLAGISTCRVKTEAKKE